MSLTFVHSADWHLGQTYWSLGAQATRSRQWRFDAVRRIWQVASNCNADFILVSGDVFETETPAAAVRDQTLELLREAPAPVYLIPGLADPCAEGSVWFNAQWQSGLTGLPSVRAALGCEPLEIEGDALLLPCPVMRKRSATDATAWMPAADRGERFRIGLAHGFWEGYVADETRTLGRIAGDCAARAGLDYLALGGHHGATPLDGGAARARAFYAGTPEIGARDDAGGEVLEVKIEHPGALPVVTPHRVGLIELRDLGEANLQNSDDWDAFVARVGELEKPAQTIVRAQLRGEVSPSLYAEIARWLAAQREKLMGVDASLERVHARPAREDFAALRLERLEESVLERLEGDLDAGDAADLRGLEQIEIWSGDPDARREALALYYRLMAG